ncbi:urokinase plasminogen activator surface receptor-like isoform X2 [Melanerpes formicivorus]|uniref:urokinase plasminogen activator surface receptor-like isoform X2 n=1 Tax=Melanerpes formicivorus TaxID=211600 RepID=UPI00358E04FC
MDWSRHWELLVLLVALLQQGGALQCPHCSLGRCQLLPCSFPNATCRRTSLSQRRGGAVLVQEEGGCDVLGPPDLTLTFRSHGALLTLSERRGAGEEQGETAPEPRQGGRPLRCLSCDASDGSCGRPLLALPLPPPRRLLR